MCQILIFQIYSEWVCLYCPGVMVSSFFPSPALYSVYYEVQHTHEKNKSRNKNRKWETVQLFFLSFLSFMNCANLSTYLRYLLHTFKSGTHRKNIPNLLLGEFEFEFDSSWMLLFSNITRKIQAKYKFIISSDVLATTWVTGLYFTH